MKKLRAWVLMMWRPILAFLAVSVIVCATLGYKLGSLTPGASNQEQQYIAGIDSGREILEQPVYAVHKIPVYALSKLHVDRLAAYRAVSAAFAALAVVSCFFVLREWYSDRIAGLGAIIFLCSAWVLHTGRLATPEASFLLLMPLLWAVVWLYNTTLRKTALLLLSFLCAACFYIPAFGWLLLMAAVWQHKRLWEELRQVPWWFRVCCFLIVAGGLVPLVLAALDSPRVLLLAAGLPDKFPSLQTLATNLLHIPEYLFLRGPNDPVRWLGRLPLLDVFSTVMLFLGVYSIRYNLKLIRIQLLVGSSLLLALLLVIGGPLTITVLMPAVYILIAGGVAFMLQQWLAVFPRNPIARMLAVTLLAGSVLLVLFYHLNHYFVAWPGAPATKAAFSGKIIQK